MKCVRLFALGLIVTGISLPAARAQGAKDGVVAGMGVVKIERMPEGMRMKVSLSAKGADLKTALATLKDKTDAAKNQLGALGATKESIKIDPPQISAGKSAQQRQMEMLMAQRLRAGGAGKKPKKEEKPPVSVAANLSAEWPLTAKTAEELLVAVGALQEKVKGADLDGGKATGQLTAEEQEALEEMESSGMDPYGQEGPKPGEPTFLFYSKVADAEREKALGEAFQKAKEKATKLARAAGAELGPLASLTEVSTGMDTDGYQNMYENPYYYRQLQQAALSGMSSGEDAAEGLAAMPGLVTFRVTVQATFAVK